MLQHKARWEWGSSFKNNKEDEQRQHLYSSYRRVFVLSNEMTSVSTSSTLVGGHYSPAIRVSPSLITSIIFSCWVFTSASVSSRSSCLSPISRWQFTIPSSSLLRICSAHSVIRTFELSKLTILELLTFRFLTDTSSSGDISRSAIFKTWTASYQNNLIRVNLVCSNLNVWHLLGVY